MQRRTSLWLAASVLAGLCAASASPASFAQQQQRYSPSRPTVSPYLNLFRPSASDNIPNYYSLVRPQQQQYQVEQQHQQLLQQQEQQIQQLQSSVQGVQQQQLLGPMVAPTGHGSWFARPATKSSFMNTSRFYSQSGTAKRQ